MSPISRALVPPGASERSDSILIILFIVLIILALGGGGYGWQTWGPAYGGGIGIVGILLIVQVWGWLAAILVMAGTIGFVSLPWMATFESAFRPNYWQSIVFRSSIGMAVVGLGLAIWCFLVNYGAWMSHG